nr:CsbD family protein [Nevskia sp.]
MSMNKTANATKDVVDDAASSAAADKAKGHTKEVIGSIKAKVGSLIGDKELEAKGHVQNAEGKKDRLKGEIKETIEDVKDKVKAGVEVVKEKFTGSDKK